MEANAEAEATPEEKPVEAKDEVAPESVAEPAPAEPTPAAESPAEPKAEAEATKDGAAVEATDTPAAPEEKAAGTEEKADTTDAAPAAPPKETSEAAATKEPEPEPEPQPSLPSVPFIVFLSPGDPISNQNGAVPTGSTFPPAPRNLYSISRAGLQVAIAKYGLGLGSRGVGVVGIERAGVDDPVSCKDYACCCKWPGANVVWIACNSVGRRGDQRRVESLAQLNAV